MDLYSLVWNAKTGELIEVGPAYEPDPVKGGALHAEDGSLVLKRWGSENGVDIRKLTDKFTVEDEQELSGSERNFYKAISLGAGGDGLGLTDEQVKAQALADSAAELKLAADAAVPADMVTTLEARRDELRKVGGPVLGEKVL